jgi:hypothetical protein
MAELMVVISGIVVGFYIVARVVTAIPEGRR